MRGSPFTFSNFAMGLNTYDSPYTLKQGEARDCLNVLSSPRGAIQKRPGSEIFAAGASSIFPNLAVTDSFTRANEDPLSNAGKWTLGKNSGNTGIGRVFGNTYMAKFTEARIPAGLEVTDSLQRANENPLAKDGKGNEAAWETFHAWEAGAEKTGGTTGSINENSWWGGIVYSGALYNVGGEQASPTVSVEIVSTGDFFLWVSKKAAKTEGYCAEIKANGNVTIRRIKAGVQEETTGFVDEVPAVGDKWALTVREGRVTTWRKRSGGWEQRNSAADTTFTSGYGGFSAPAAGARLKNFAIGETENALATGRAYWNVAEQTNPAASVMLSGTPVEGEVGVAVSMNATQSQGYEAAYDPANKRVILRKYTSQFNATQLATTTTTLTGLDSLGISVRNGVVTSWKKSHVANVWTVLAAVNDATYNKGFSGVVISNNGNAALTNFTTGEIGAPPAESIFTSLLPCNIGGVQYLIAASGTKLYSITTTGEINTIKEGVTEGERWSIVQAAKGTREVQGPVYLSNGVDPPQYWTGATKTTLTVAWTSKPEGTEFADITVFKPKYLTYHANRVWAAGLSGDESAVRFSGLATVAGEGEKADPTSWPKENVVWFEKDNGSAISGIGTVGPYVVVFKPHQTWIIYNLDEGENRQISDTIGCISNRSIVETHLGTFFLTPDQGVYLTNGSTLKEVSRNVRPILQGTDSNTTRAAKQNELKNAAGGYLNGHYYLSYMAQDGSMKTLDYDTVLNSWWLHDLAGNQWVAWEPTTGNSSLYTVPNKVKAGVVKAFVPGVYQDSGANYVGARGFTAFWLSSWEPFWQYFMRHRFQQPQIRKRIRALFVDGKGELITIVFKKFGTSFEELKGVVELGDQATLVNPVDLGEPLGEAGVEYQPVRYYALGTSRIWSFGFGNKSANFFEVDSYAADLSFRKA